MPLYQIFKNVSKNFNSGFEDEMYKDIVDGNPSNSCPPTALLPSVRYEKMMSMFNGKEQNGYLCRTNEDIEDAMRKTMQVTDSPSLINIMINPMAQRKAQAFEWLTRSNL